MYSGLFSSPRAFRKPAILSHSVFFLFDDVMCSKGLCTLHIYTQQQTPFSRVTRAHSNTTDLHYVSYIVTLHMQNALLEKRTSQHSSLPISHAYLSRLLYVWPATNRKPEIQSLEDHAQNQFARARLCRHGDRATITRHCARTS